MKTIKIFLLLTLGVFLTACEIEEIVPLNQLTEDNVVTDEPSAEALLNGAYTYFRTLELFSNFAGFTFLGADTTENTTPFGFEGYATNNVQTDSYIANESYTLYYEIINNVNFLIDLVEAGKAVGLSETRKNELLAEAKTMRAIAHFYLLRSFGQFYDLNSSLGIVLRTEPARGQALSPRNSVQECYDAIISDLQFGIENGPSGVPHYIISAITAKALLAKVYISMGDFENAAIAASEVINNNDGYALETTYAEAFNRWDAAETLFAAYGGADLESTWAGFYYFPLFISPSPSLSTLADEQDNVIDGDASFATGYDQRLTLSISGHFFSHGKYPRGFLNLQDANAIYLMRMAEVYLIFAEAETRRQGGDKSLALSHLNQIRTRAGVPLKTYTDDATLLKDIRNEKRLELFNETGEEWFDLIRYDRLGNLSAQAEKFSLTTVDKYILPIPRNAIAGNNQLVQNPGY